MVKAGQIWKDNDPRMARYIKVLAIGGTTISIPRTVTIQRCNPDGTSLAFGWQAPKTKTRLSRFGKTGRIGFTLVKEAP